MEGQTLDGIWNQPEWVISLWEPKGPLKVVQLGKSFFLFEFKSVGEVERVLNFGKRNFRGNLLHLIKWSRDLGSLENSNYVREAWVRVLGLPAHLWSHSILKKIGDGCGGFIAVDKVTASSSELFWARILVRVEGRALPKSVEIVVGSC